MEPVQSSSSNTLTTANGQPAPPLGLGTWKMSAEEAYDVVRQALDIGYRHFDCAWIYGNEAGIGRALADALRIGQVQREDLFITSKLWNDCHQPADVQPALQASLSDLRLDYLDLYLMHWPISHVPGVPRPAAAPDFLTWEQMPLARTWQALAQCVEKGLSRFVGVSNFSQKKLANLIAETQIRPSMNQVESHPYLQQRDLWDYCQKTGIGFTAYSPLGSGDRPDPMRRHDEPVLLQDPVVTGIAQDLGASPGQVLLAWGLGRPTWVIPKAARLGNLKANWQPQQIQLSPTHRAQLNSLERHYRFVDGAFWEVPEGPYTRQNLWDEPN